MYNKEPKLNFSESIWKVNLDANLHRLMREVAARKRTVITDQYEAAIDSYLEIERIPKRIEKVSRSSIRLKASKDFKVKVEALRMIAKKKKQSLSVLLEEVLESFLDKPENYLGKSFYERNKRKMEIVK